MNVAFKQSIKRLRSLFLIGVIAFGLMTIVGSNGDGGGEGEQVTPAPETGDLEGRVYTGNWDGISGARVCLVAHSCTSTDERAWYLFSDVDEGVYVITASASGYSYYSGNVEIRPGIANQHHIQLDPE